MYEVGSHWLDHTHCPLASLCLLLPQVRQENGPCPEQVRQDLSQSKKQKDSDACLLTSSNQKCTSPTSAFVGVLVVVRVAAALGQALSIVTDGSGVATRVTGVGARAVARGAIGVAANALLLLLAGKVPVRAVIHTLTSVQEVVLVALWVGERVKGPLTISHLAPAENPSSQNI